MCCRAVLGIEPRTSRARSEHHTTRPNSQLMKSDALCRLVRAPSQRDAAAPPWAKYVLARPAPAPGSAPSLGDAPVASPALYSHCFWQPRPLVHKVDLPRAAARAAACQHWMWGQGAPPAIQAKHFLSPDSSERGGGRARRPRSRQSTSCRQSALSVAGRQMLPRRVLQQSCRRQAQLQRASHAAEPCSRQTTCSGE